jgi:putative RecB family exonuclease
VNPETGEFLPKLIGRFDALVEDPDGRVRLLEHKTSSRRFSESRLAHDLQPTAYGLALLRRGIEATVTFQVLLKTKTPALELYDVERGPQDHRDLIETIIGVHRAVEAGAFHPVRDWWCQGCPYSGPCVAG